MNICMWLFHQIILGTKRNCTTLNVSQFKQLIIVLIECIRKHPFRKMSQKKENTLLKHETLKQSPLQCSRPKVPNGSFKLLRLKRFVFWKTIK